MLRMHTCTINNENVRSWYSWNACECRVMHKLSFFSLAAYKLTSDSELLESEPELSDLSGQPHFGPSAGKHFI